MTAMLDLHEELALSALSRAPVLLQGRQPAVYDSLNARGLVSIIRTKRARVYSITNDGRAALERAKDLVPAKGETP